MANQPISKDYSEILRLLETTDPGSAATFNPLFERLINNDAFLKDKQGNLAALAQSLKDAGADGNLVAAINEIVAQQAEKVQQVEGKGLSTEDYTTAEKSKLSGIATGANKYVHPTSAGYKHIPSGGATGQVLGYGGASGVASWQNAGGFEVIATASVKSTDNVYKIDFENLGLENYKHLKIVCYNMKSKANSGGAPSLSLKFNDSTDYGYYYAKHRSTSNGADWVSESGNGKSSFDIGYVFPQIYWYDRFGTAIIDIVDNTIYSKASVLSDTNIATFYKCEGFYLTSSNISKITLRHELTSPNIESMDVIILGVK